jgi:YVTN family beta-propeller protein
MISTLARKVMAVAGSTTSERLRTAPDSRRANSPHARRPLWLRAIACTLLLAAAGLIPPFAHGQTVTANVPDSNQPHGIAINPITNKIYIADDTGTLTVVDGATNAVSTIYYGSFGNWAVAVNPVTNFVYVVDRSSSTVDVFSGATATSPAAFVKSISPGNGNLYAIALNPVTNMVYVADDGNAYVIVINGSTNTEVTTVSLGGSPIVNTPVSIAVNPATNTIYAADNDTNNVSVINGSNNAVIATLAVGSNPQSIAVDAASNKIYVANTGSNNVSVIDGSTNTVSATLSDPNANSPVMVAVNPTTNQIYVANSGSSNTTIINGATNVVTDVQTSAGTSTFASVAVDTSTNLAYVANSGNGTVIVINGSNFNETQQLTAQPNTAQIAVNPVTHKIYAADYSSGGPVGITVIDGATNAVQPLTPPIQGPAVVAVNPVTDLIYVANTFSNNVSVIDGSTNTILTTVTTDTQPAAIVVDPINNLVYVANRNGGDITVIDSAFNTSTITFTSPLGPDELAFNPVLNMVFGASRGTGLGFQFFSQDGSQQITPFSLFAGTQPSAAATNPALGYNVYLVTSPNPGIQVSDIHGGFSTGICGNAIAEAMDVNTVTNAIYVACGDGSVNVMQQADSFTSGNIAIIDPPGMVRAQAVAVNPVTNMAYVADTGSSNVYVINGANDLVTATIPITSASSNPVNPVAVAVNVTTNKIYVVSQDNQNNTPNVTMIDGATNTILSVIPLLSPGAFTGEVAANPVTGNIYALDWMGGVIDVITENVLLPNALQTIINPLPANTTNTTSPSFSFSTANGLSSAPVTGVYYQLDTQQGPWTAAVTSGGGNFSGPTSGITPGFHILYAYATDGEDGAAGNSGPYGAQNGPLVGTIASYGFLVAPPIAITNFYPGAFGNVAVGTTSSVFNPVLINGGPSPMAYSFAITGPNSSDFHIITNYGSPSYTLCAVPSGTLAGNSVCEVDVAFSPSALGAESASLTFTDNSLGIPNSTQSVGLNGTGVAAPTFSNLTPSQSITVGTSSINLSGTISSGGNFPSNNETVAITINSMTQNAAIGANGHFAMAYNTSGIPASPTPYPITYSYPGDNNFGSAMDSSTTLTVNAVSTFYSGTASLLGTGTGSITDNQGPQISCSEAGGVTAGTCSGSYASGTPLTLTANPTAPTTFGGWGGACSSFGTALSCSFTVSSSFAVTANFVAPPTTVNVTFPAGTNSTQTARFACPSGHTPCTDANAHELQLTIPSVSTSIPMTVLATEVPPTQEDGLCESGNTVLNDFDCRFETFFNGGASGNNIIAPLCDPYANGNCVHYTVYSTTGGPGTEPNPTLYNGGVYWQITWNNDTFTPPASNWLNSVPQVYDDPDGTPAPGAAIGTNCNVPMTINGINQNYSCQFEFNITTFYDPTQPVDAGIGASTKQFNDVVVAFPPTSELPANSAPAFTSAANATFTVGAPASFVVSATGFPTPSILAASLPPGITFNTVTGILGGTPTTAGISHVTFTATNTVTSTPQMFTLNVQQGATAFVALASSQAIPFGTASINLSGTIAAGSAFPPSGETVTITINGASQPATIGANGVFATTFNTATIPASVTPYPITYSYAGDTNFAGINNSSTALTVNTLNTFVSGSVQLLGTGTGAVTDNQNQVNCSEANGITAGTCTGSYGGGTLVTFTANPTAPTTFGGWGGACSGTSLTCQVLASSTFSITANFVPAPKTVALTFPTGANPPPQEAIFNCPSNTNPCTDPNAHALQLSIPNVNSTVNVTVLATEVPPSQADGLCESGNTVLNDFDCRFVTFFSDGTDAHSNTIVPLCHPYANGNCVHYLVYSTTGGPGVEPNPSSYSGGVYWQITWNNDSFVPPATYYSGSTPQVYDDPDYALTPTSAVGTSCSQPMTINGVNQSYFCQFEFDITTFYDPTQKVDSGIGASTKQFNDVVVAFPPTVTGSNPVVQPPTATAPAISGTCLTGCVNTVSTITFAVGTGGTFQVVPTGYPAPKLTESGTLPNGITMNILTGILSGTPASGTSGNFPISFTATNSTGTITQVFVLTVSALSQTITFAAPASPAAYNSTFPVSATSTSGLPVTIAASGVCTIASGTVTMTSGTGTCTLTASQAGNANYGPAANVVQTVTASLATQTITFTAPASPAAYNSTFAVSATSSSALTVTIAASGVCTIASGTVTMTSGTGTCTLTASQAGNTNFSAATSVVRTVTAALAAQTISFTGAPTSAAYGSTFTVTASATSGLAVTITSSGACSNSGATVTITAGSGTCSLTASQAGNANYGAAPTKTQSTTATKANSTTTITSNTPNPSTVNQAVTIAFKVTGAGTPTGSVTVTASAGGSCTGTLTSGAGSCTITFTTAASPTLTAAYAGDGNFNTSTSAAVTQTVNPAAGSTLKISPATLNFGTAYVGVPAFAATTLTNTGTSMITFTNFTVAAISGDDSTGFLGVELCPKTLNAGKSCTILMSFTSDSNVTKTHAANIVITDNATGSPQSIPMSATVINPIASLSPSSVNFGNQKTGTTSASQSVTLKNSGTTPLDLSLLKMNGNFAFASGTTCTSSTTLAAGATCLMKITFTPTTKGSKTGSVTIGDNALVSTSTVSLSGNGD